MLNKRVFHENLLTKLLESLHLPLVHQRCQTSEREREREKEGEGNLSGSQRSLLRGRCRESGPFPTEHQHISNPNLKETSLCSFDGNALTAFGDTKVQLQEPGCFAF